MNEIIRAATDVITAIAALPLPAGALTDDEEMALEVVDYVIGGSRLLSQATGNDEDEVFEFLSALPALARLIMEMIASFRSVIARGEQISVEIGDIGNVVVEPL